MRVIWSVSRTYKTEIEKDIQRAREREREREGEHIVQRELTERSCKF